MSSKKSKKSLGLHKLFWNDRFVIIFSLVVSIIFWAAVCVSFSPNTTNVIENVPVVIDTKNSVPSQCGLQVFGDESFTVDITVSGSRYVIGENLLSADDFTVTALTSSVTTAGTHSLQIRVSKANEDANFTIDSVSENFITVYFDALDKKEVPVTVQLNKTDFVKPGYITDNNFIMDSKTVVVTGPALEMAQLDSVVADVQVPGDQLSATTTCEASLTAYSNNHTALKFVKINGEDMATMNVSIPIYRMGSHSLDVSFTNAPSAYASSADSLFNYRFSPSGLNIAVLQNGTQNDKLNIGNIDFSEIKPGSNKFKFDLENVKNVKADSTKVKTVEVNFDLSNVASKYVMLSLDKLAVLNAPKGKSIKFNNAFITVQVVGKEADLEKINTDSLEAKIDFSNNINSSSGEIFEGPIYLTNSKKCWIYGTYELSYYLSD